MGTERPSFHLGDGPEIHRTCGYNRVLQLHMVPLGRGFRIKPSWCEPDGAGKLRAKSPPRGTDTVGTALPTQTSDALPKGAQPPLRQLACLAPQRLSQNCTLPCVPSPPSSPPPPTCSASSPGMTVSPTSTAHAKQAHAQQAHTQNGHTLQPAYVTRLSSPKARGQGIRAGPREEP